MRNRDATALLDTGFAVLAGRAAGQYATVATELPKYSHPAFRGGPIVEQGSDDEESGRRVSSRTKAHHAATHKTAKHGATRTKAPRTSVAHHAAASHHAAARSTKAARHRHR